MFSRLKKLFKQRSYFGFIELNSYSQKVTCVDAKTEKEVPERSFYVTEKYQSIKEFIEDIPNVFCKNFKTVTLKVLTFDTPEFSNNIKFCEALKLKLDSIKIPYYFIPDLDFMITCLFAVANITVKNQDTVKMVLTENDKYLVVEFLFNENGYDYISSHYVSTNENFEIVRRDILKSTKPAKILATSIMKGGENEKLLKDLKNIMQKSDGLVYSNIQDYSARIQGVIEISKWILDNTYVKCHTSLKCRREYLIVGKVGEKYLPAAILAERHCLLPYEGSGHILRSNTEYALAYTDYNYSDPINLESIPNYKNCHFSLITINIDINNFYTLQVQPNYYGLIEYLPVFLNEKRETKIPVIGFFDNLSVICVYKNDAEYKFIDQWNGLEGKDLMISFAEEEPKFCENAINDSKTMPSFVVLDLIQIMSLPIDEIQPQPYWCFTFTKDSENPILIEFDNFDGTKTAASPAFLMAMLLKEHLKAIKNETGKKPKEIAFCFFNKLEDEERTRIKDGLKEACKLLKVECHFIKIEF